MRRRNLILGIGGLIAQPLAARAQQKAMPTVGVLHSGSPGAYAAAMAAYQQGLGEAGFVEGRNAAVEYRWAEGHYDRLPIFAAELVQRRVEVITAATHPAAIAAKAATSTIPIVFSTGADPVEAGLVTSLARPGGNLTGISDFTARLDAKRLQLLRELAPRTETIALLLNPENTNAGPQSKETQTAAGEIAQPLLILNAASEIELDRAFAELVAKQVGGLIVGPDPFFNSRRDYLIALVARHAVPTIYYDRVYVESGGLISYGNNIAKTYRQVGRVVGRILAGAKPADLPVEQPVKFELVIDLKTATALGLTVPQALLARADEVIE